MFEWLGDKFDALWNNIKFITVFEFQEGIIYRNGRFRKLIKRGIHWRIPFFESYKIVNIMPETFQIASVTITTIDGKSVTIGAVLERHISDTITYIQNFNGPDGNLHDLTRSLIANHISTCKWDDVRLPHTQETIAVKVAEECHRMGMTATTFSFTEMAVTRMFTILPAIQKGTTI